MADTPTRVEAFSDGVFAIAITLLILEIRVPHVEHGLWRGLFSLWPSYVAFLLSFLVILIMWVNHHELMRLVRGVNYPFLFANGLLLLTVTFVPFPAAVLGEHLGKPEAKSAVAFYCATFVANSLAWNLLFRTIVRTGLLEPDVAAETVAKVRRAYYFGPLVYLIATLLAFIQPAAGLLVNASLWILWVRLGYRAARISARSGAVVVILAVSACDKAAPDKKEDFATMQARGEQVMGVNQFTSAHVFEDLSDGGRVVLDRADSADTAAITTIRAHMRDIATAFRAGDFTKPFEVHAQRVPGTTVMTARRDAISYDAIDRPRGGEVRIRSSDRAAVAAIHQFLAFQRDQHRAAGHETH